MVGMYYFIEGVFTNSGGRAVAALELISGEGGGFVYTMRLVRGQPITYRVHHEKSLPLTLGNYLIGFSGLLFYPMRWSS